MRAPLRAVHDFISPAERANVLDGSPSTLSMVGSLPSDPTGGQEGACLRGKQVICPLHS